PWCARSRRRLRPTPMVLRTSPAGGQPGSCAAIAAPPRRSRTTLYPRWVRDRGGDGSQVRRSSQAADAKAPVARRVVPVDAAGLRGRRGFFDVEDPAVAEQVAGEVLGQHRIAAAQPFQEHRGVLLLLVTVVGEQRRQLGVRRGRDSLVVPVDRLELLHYRHDRPVTVLERVVQDALVLVIPLTRRRHGARLFPPAVGLT